MDKAPKIGLCPVTWSFEVVGEEGRCERHFSVPVAAVDIPTQMREDGRVEGVCEHGIGHTLIIPERVTKSAESTAAWFAHGCDGCCKVWWGLIDA